MNKFVKIVYGLDMAVTCDCKDPVWGRVEWSLVAYSHSCAGEMCLGVLH